MQTTSILFGLIPLLAFVIAESFLGLKKALIFTIVLAVAEAILSFMLFGELDIVTISSLVLVLVFAYFSYRYQSSVHIKFQPVVLSASFGLALIVSYFMQDPLLLKLMTKYKGQMPASYQEMLANPLLDVLYTEVTLFLGMACLIHAAWTAYAALKLPSWKWILIKSLGFYLLMMLAFGAGVIKMKMAMG